MHSPRFYTRNFETIFRTPFGHFPDIMFFRVAYYMQHTIFNIPAFRHMVRKKPNTYFVSAVRFADIRSIFDFSRSMSFSEY